MEDAQVMFGLVWSSDFEFQPRSELAASNTGLIAYEYSNSVIQLSFLSPHVSVSTTIKEAPSDHLNLVTLDGKQQKTC